MSAAWFLVLHPVALTLMATLFTCGLTALGIGTVFFLTTINQKSLDGMVTFAPGTMIFVVMEYVAPESQQAGNTNLATMGAITDFAVMMPLGVAHG